MFLLIFRMKWGKIVQTSLIFCGESMTREVESDQIELGQTAIAQIQFNPKSRDDIPKILRGLQYLYLTDSIREPIFKLLEEKILPSVNKKNGRPGLSLWKILVMGVLRLDLNCDYDRLEELVNHHDTVRQMLGHADLFDKTPYHFQTIKDNVRLLTPELLEGINQIIVKAGHALLGKKKENERLRGRCDSFVVETNVHYPTDINLLYDAVRKVIQLTAQLSERYELSDWRQQAYNVKQVKKQLRITQKKKRLTGKSEDQRTKNEKAVKQAHQEMIKLSQRFLQKSEATCHRLMESQSLRVSDLGLLEGIHHFSNHAQRQINQITRRVLYGEIIPHAEKVFSLFQPHTEWISKGKIGVPVELGVRVCVLEDQHQFILTHRVMERETDAHVAVPMVTKTKAAFPALSSCSFDKGFHSPENQEMLSEQLAVVALKRKGKLSQKAKAIETSEAFTKARYKHAAIESAINALEVHGLDKCRDHGIDGFKRYVALAIVARNIHRVGAILYRKEQAKIARQIKRCRNGTFLLAA